MLPGVALLRRNVSSRNQQGGSVCVELHLPYAKIGWLPLYGTGGSLSVELMALFVWNRWLSLAWNIHHYHEYRQSISAPDDPGIGIFQEGGHLSPDEYEHT